MLLPQCFAFLCVSASVNLPSTWRFHHPQGGVSLSQSTPPLLQDGLKGRVPLGTSQEGDLGQGLDQHLPGNSKAQGGLLEGA